MHFSALLTSCRQSSNFLQYHGTM